MSTRNSVLIGAVLLAFAAPALPVAAPPAQADPLVFDPHQPGHHRGEPAYYNRYRVLAPDWFERRDSITLQHGNAVHSNQVIQMRDPWPPYVGNRDIQFDGMVMDRAIDRYKAGTVPAPGVGN